MKNIAPQMLSRTAKKSPEIYDFQSAKSVFCGVNMPDFSKVLILSWHEMDRGLGFSGLESWRRCGCYADVFFDPESKKSQKLYQKIQKLEPSLDTKRGYYRLSAFLQNRLFRSWRKHLRKVETVIVYPWHTTRAVIKYIKQVNPNIRVCIYYGNPVARDMPLENYTDLGVDIFTFDEGDAKNYGLHKVDQFVDDFLCREIANETAKEYDISYNGDDKGRLEDLLMLKRLFEGVKLDFYLHVTAQLVRTSETYQYQKIVSYQKSLEIDFSAKATLEWLTPEQSSMTLRAPACQFAKQKLITNNKNIVSEEFYHPDNIFVIDDLSDDKFLDELKKWMEIPFHPLENSVLQKYTYAGFLMSVLDSDVGPLNCH